MRQGLTMVPRIEITDAMIIDCDVPEDDHDEYNPATTYAKGDRVQVLARHKVWQSVADDNMGNPLPTGNGDTAHWKLVGATNRHRCLGTSLSPRTTNPGGFAYRFRPSRVVNAVYIEAALVDTVRVTMVDPVEGIVYDTYDINMGGVLRRSSVKEWFFGRRRRRTYVLLLDLPSYYGADIFVEATVATGDASVGLILFGYQEELGEGVKLGARVGITDFSKVVVNDFGDPVFQRLAYSDRASFDLVIPAGQVDDVKDALVEQRSQPCLWVGSELYRTTIIFGWYADFDILINYPTESDCSLELKGMPKP